MWVGHIKYNKSFMDFSSFNLILTVVAIIFSLFFRASNGVWLFLFGGRNQDSTAHLVDNFGITRLWVFSRNGHDEKYYLKASFYLVENFTKVSPSRILIQQSLLSVASTAKLGIPIKNISQIIFKQAIQMTSKTKLITFTKIYCLFFHYPV